MLNICRSYANDKSSLISINLDEDRGIARIIIAFVVTCVLFTAVPLTMMALQTPHPHPALSLPWSDHPVVHDVRPKLGENGNQISHEPHNSAAPQDGVQDTSMVALSMIPDHKASGQVLAKSTAYWDNPLAGERCRAFGSREYTAQLRNLPFFADWESACKNTPITINGVPHSHPSRCEKKVSLLFPSSRSCP